MLSPNATNLVPPSAGGGGRGSSRGGTGGGSWDTVATMAEAEVSVGAVGDVEHPEANATINAVKEAVKKNVPAMRLALGTRPTQTISS
jgi:hypothetical protein